MKKCILLLEVITLIQHILGNLTTHETPQNTNITEFVEYVLIDEKDPCNRRCVPYSFMTCRYKFVLESYDAMSKACYDCPLKTEDCFKPDCIPVDGIKRPVVVVNRRLPGPSIQVCAGDEIIVDVENELLSDSTTIHWHGQHQRNSPYMDGVPWVSQCPILPRATFRYHFRAETPGTHFWHSHTGMQRADGAFGSLIVRVPDTIDSHRSLYDFDRSSHVIILLDWGHVNGMQKFVAHHHNTGDNKPTNLLVNGLGRFKLKYNETSPTAYMPTARFTVEQGYRYRFRIINAGFLNCPIEFSVDNHTLTVISSDGNDFAPVYAESLVTYAGERFDVIINANQSIGTYWMKFRGLMDCDQRFKSAYQVAVLEYSGANDTYPDEEPDYYNTHKEGLQVNALNKGIESNGSSFVTAPQLQSLAKFDVSLKETPDLKYFVAYDFYKIDNPHFNKFPYYGFENISDPNNLLLTPQLNYISMQMLPFPFMSQRYQIEEGMLCNETTVSNCDKEYCECPHVVRVPLGSVVELILIDKGVAFDANHPFHLHGGSFRVVAMEKIGSSVTVQEVYDRDVKGLIKRNLVNPPLKDTVTVPDGGYTIVRFHATNPGFWLLHCHIEFHAEVGMALVFKIGEDNEMLPIPPNFPTCGDYVPNNELPDCDRLSTVEWLEDYLSAVFGKKCKRNGGNAAEITRSIFLLSFILAWTR